MKVEISTRRTHGDGVRWVFIEDYVGLFRQYNKESGFFFNKIDKIGVKHFILDWKWNFIWIKGELKEETREDDECVNEQWYLKTWRCCIQSYDLRILSSCRF